MRLCVCVRERERERERERFLCPLLTTSSDCPGGKRYLSRHITGKKRSYAPNEANGYYQQHVVRSDALDLHCQIETCTALGP